MRSKKVILYHRISSKDQSNFSLDFQQMINEQYCQEQGLEIVSTFTDDGYSAKDFNRPGWKQAQAFIRANRSSLYAVIVAKYDRLIRNAAEGLAWLEKVETSWGVRVLASMQSIGIDPYDPEFFRTRASMFVQAQYEWYKIQDRTKSGIYYARLQGRLANRAPWPYTNAKDQHNRPIIVLEDLDGAAIVEQAARDFSQGMPMQQITQRARDAGWPRTGKSAMTRLITNPVHAGLVEVPGYRGKAPQIVQGMQPACYPEALFWENQNRLNGDPAGRYVENIHLPLRGFLQCAKCGHVLTGGRSRSKTGRYYWYYNCQRCSRANYSAARVHSRIKTTFDEMSLPDHYLEKVEQMITRKIDDHLRASQAKARNLTQILEGQSLKLDAVEEKYIMGQIDQETFEKWQKRYQGNIMTAKSELETLTDSHAAIWRAFLLNLGKLASLGKIFDLASPVQKQSLTRAMFGTLQADKERLYADLNSVTLLHNHHGFSFLTLKKDGGNDCKAADFPISTRSGGSLELFRVEKLISVIEKIAA